jgi:hypothetical protein
MILVVAPGQIRQGKVAPGVFVKQPGAITPELLVLTYKASTGNNMEDGQELRDEYCSNIQEDMYVYINTRQRTYKEPCKMMTGFPSYKITNPDLFKETRVEKIQDM